MIADADANNLEKDIEVDSKTFIWTIWQECK